MTDGEIVEVTTPSGRLQGRTDGAVTRFLGVRYALAPRFEPPEPVPRWRGTVDALQPGDEAPQLAGMLSTHLGLFTPELPQSEDCLRLNVFTPGSERSDRPVIVWLHGGAYTSGGGANPWYDGGALAAAHDVVVVTLNYRLGLLGFLGRRNLGTQDQLAALHWVRSSIDAFGGDPGNVTVAGASAGGSSIVALLATQDGPGLIDRCFLSSPSIEQIRTTERADDVEAIVVERAGGLDRLHSAPIHELLALQAHVLGLPGGGLTGFSPCADGTLIGHAFLERAAEAPQPMVLGTAADELQLFAASGPPITEEELRHTIAAELPPEQVPAALDHYRRRHPDDDRRAAAAFESDRSLHVPVARLAEARSRRERPTWVYRFAWRSIAHGGVLGSCHGLDVPFVFGNLDADGVEEFTGRDQSRAAVSAELGGRLTGLARHGDPGWPKFGLPSRTALRIDRTTDVCDDLDGDRPWWRAPAR